MVLRRYREITIGTVNVLYTLCASERVMLASEVTETREDVISLMSVK